jgi:branched-chain amino acid transport system substrate-binding protein
MCALTWDPIIGPAPAGQKDLRQGREFFALGRHRSVFDLPAVRPHYDLMDRRQGHRPHPHRLAVYPSVCSRRAMLGGVTAGIAVLAAGCSGMPGGDTFGGSSSAPAPAGPAAAIGNGAVRVGLVLPLSAAGNAGVAAQSMKNAAEMALAEFNNPNVALLFKDDGGTAPGAQQAVSQALAESAEIIIGPLFAHSVAGAAQVARPRGVPVIAFSTDANVAAAGIYLLSFLPESDVDRIVDYAVANGKRSFVALVPDNAYGSVVDGEFRQVVGRKGGRVVAIEHYPLDKAALQEPVKRAAMAARQADSIFIPDGAESVPGVVQGLAGNGVDLHRIQLLGTGLWDDPRVFADSALQGGLFAAPEAAGYHNFAARYRRRFGGDPVRTATLAYDAVSLVAALVKTQGPQRFSAEVLTNPSGFSGVDGIFRFRPDGTNQRGLAVLRVTASGAQSVSPAPHTFSASG